jgi:hypothetical protein
MSVFETFTPAFITQSIEDFFDDVRPRLEVVPNTQKRLTTVQFASVIFGIFGLALFFSAVLSSSISQNAYQVQTLNSEIKDARLEMQTLQQQLTVMTAPATLHKRAQLFGMVPMASPVFLRLEDGAILGKPVPAQKIKDSKSQVPTLDSNSLSMNQNGTKILDASQLRVDDSAFLVVAGRD